MSSTTNLHVIRQVLQAKFKKQNLQRNFELTVTCTESQKNQHGEAREKRSLLKKVKATFIPTGAADCHRFEQEQLESDLNDHGNRLELKQSIILRPISLKKFTKNYTGSKFFNVYGVPGATKTSEHSLFFGSMIDNYPKDITSGLPKADRVEISSELLSSQLLL